MQETTESFNWEEFEASNRTRLRVNKKIAEKYPGSQVYCHESYAMEMYEKMMNIEVVRKDFNDGDIFRVVNVRSSNSPMKLEYELENGLSVSIDMAKERKYCSIYNSTPEQFVAWVTSKEGKQAFVGSKPPMLLTGAKTTVKGDLLKGHTVKTQNEFLAQITEASAAYVAKVLSRNKGGFIVDVCGVEAFLPGGLAAANKIVDFDSYIGKTVMVMVEDFLQDTKTFVFSNKKYISKILPSKLKELDLGNLYKGTVTGTTKFGIFIEWDEIFTGLLHTTKMTPETLDAFNQRKFRPGDEITFWIKEISKDGRIILTEEDPSEKMAAFEDFKTKSVGVVQNGKVVKNIPFGTLVKLEKDLIGLISKQELKTKKKSFQPGDDVIVTVDAVKKDKIYLSLIDETQELQ